MRLWPHGGDATASTSSLPDAKVEPDGRANVVGADGASQSVLQSRRATRHGRRNAALEERRFQRVFKGGGESWVNVVRGAGGRRREEVKWRAHLLSDSR